VEHQPVRPAHSCRHGFTGVIDGWVTTITTALEDSDSKADPLDHELVAELLPIYLEELSAVEVRRAELDAKVKAATVADDDDYDGESSDERLPPAELAALKKNLAMVRKQQRSMRQEFVTKLGKARAELTAAQQRDLVLRLFENDVTAHLQTYVTASRQQIIAALENWWDKYAVSMAQIEAERNAIIGELAAFLKDLGYD
jgi:type I restriction enzyme M protein